MEKDIFSILACYYPLYKLIERIPSLMSFKPSSLKISGLFKLQVLNPLEERELSKELIVIGSIENSVSKKVRDQYEKRPFPAWRHNFDCYNNKIPVQKIINSSIYPNSIINTFNPRKLKVLIAGCGTGNQVINATRYRDSKITGIELSASSLSYAQRKLNELGIKNVELLQMDILELSLLKEKFEIIESSGVLHHMKNPNEGIVSLLQVLSPNGFMKLGLYSQKARQTIQKARDYIKSRQIEVNEKNLREFRMSIFKGDLPEFESFKQEPLFYTLSGLEDLCFHTKEQQLDLQDIQKMIKKYKLNFHGFILPGFTKSRYQQDFPEDKKQTNLQNWAKFEEKHPTTFAGMYQFWVSKKEN